MNPFEDAIPILRWDNILQQVPVNEGDETREKEGVVSRPSLVHGANLSVDNAVDMEIDEGAQPEPGDDLSTALTFGTGGGGSGPGWGRGRGFGSNGVGGPGKGRGSGFASARGGVGGLCQDTLGQARILLGPVPADQITITPADWTKALGEKMEPTRLDVFGSTLMTAKPPLPAMVPLVGAIAIDDPPLPSLASTSTKTEAPISQPSKDTNPTANTFKQPTIKGDGKSFKEDLITSLKAELLAEIKDELLDELCEELMDDMKQQLKETIVSELREELLEEIKNDLIEELRDELKDQIKEELLSEFREELVDELKDELKAEIEEEIKSEIL